MRGSIIFSILLVSCILTTPLMAAYPGCYMTPEEKAWDNEDLDPMLWWDAANFGWQKRIAYFARQSATDGPYVFGVPMVCQDTNLGEDVGAYAVSATLMEGMFFKNCVLTCGELIKRLDDHKVWDTFDPDEKFLLGDVVYWAPVNAEDGYEFYKGIVCGIIADKDENGDFWAAMYLPKYKTVKRVGVNISGKEVYMIQRHKD